MNPVPLLPPFPVALLLLLLHQQLERSKSNLASCTFSLPPFSRRKTGHTEKIFPFFRRWCFPFFSHHCVRRGTSSLFVSLPPYIPEIVRWGSFFLDLSPLFLSPMFLFFSLCIKTGERAKKGERKKRMGEGEGNKKEREKNYVNISQPLLSSFFSSPKFSPPSLFAFPFCKNERRREPSFFLLLLPILGLRVRGMQKWFFFASFLDFPPPPSSPPHSSPRFCFKREKGKGREREGGEMIKKSSFYFFFLLHTTSLLRPQNATHTRRLTPLRAGHSREPQPPAHPQRDLRLVPGALCALQNASHHLEGKNSSCSDRSIVQSEIIGNEEGKWRERKMQHLSDGPIKT